MSVSTTAESSGVSTFQTVFQPLTDKHSVSGWEGMGKFVQDLTPYATIYNLNRVYNGITAAALLGTYLYSPDEYNLTEWAIQIGVHTYQAMLPENASKVYHTAALALGLASGGSMVHHTNLDSSTFDQNYSLYSLFVKHSINLAVNIKSVIKGSSDTTKTYDKVSDDESGSLTDKEGETLEERGLTNLTLNPANPLPFTEIIPPAKEVGEVGEADEEENVTGEEGGSSKEESASGSSSQPVSPEEIVIETKVAAASPELPKTVAPPELPKKVSEPKLGSVESKKVEEEKDLLEVNENSDADETSSEEGIEGEKSSSVQESVEELLAVLS